MEAVAFVSGESWSDHPECACPVIGAFLRAWNDGLPDDKRDKLMRPLIPLLIETKASNKIEQRRAVMAADWIIRFYTPAWLKLAGLSAHADALAALPEITDFAQCPSIMGVLNAARDGAAAARATAWDAARATAWDAARAAAWATARATARATLAQTVSELQISALDLVHRMIAVSD
jgi:hypothetical protein